MSYEKFREQTIQQNGDFFHNIVDSFFEKAVELATNEKYEEAIEVGNDALIMAKYSNVGYAIVYVFGMLCQAYLDNGEPEIADGFFKYGIRILDENESTYDRDVDWFLDLKIIIEEELKKKNKSLEE